MVCQDVMCGESGCDAGGLSGCNIICHEDVTSFVTNAASVLSCLVLSFLLRATCLCACGGGAHGCRYCLL